MKKIILLLTLVLSGSAFAFSPALDPAISSVEKCLKEEGILLCDANLPNILRATNINIRGEFVLYIKPLINQNEKSVKLIVNAYEKLSALLPMYVELDTCSEWSCRDLSGLVDDVTIKFAKASKIDSKFLIELMKKQNNGGGRYGLILTMTEKGRSNITLSEVEELITFAEFAKDFCKSKEDPFYVAGAAVNIVREMTHKSLSMRESNEGIYSINFENAAAASELNIDKLVLMDSNVGDGAVVNFVSSKSRVIKLSFTGAGLLGTTFFSNEDVYNNDQSSANQYFKFDLDRTTMTIKGFLTTARYGKLYFSGKLAQNHATVYSVLNVKGLNITQLEGKYSVRVGSYNMILVISKRADERSEYEAALFNDNAMITFSRVNLDSDRGVLTLVEWNNSRELILAVKSFDGKAELNGQFLNSQLALVLPVSTK